MSELNLHELNQHYVRLTDRCRSQWTFYQYLQGLFKHLFSSPCPIEIDFPALFNEFRQLGAELGHPETGRTERAMSHLDLKLDAQGRRLLEVDGQIQPSLLRRFFDRLRNQDEKVLLAIIKFYLDGDHGGEDTLDKLDILFTRLAEVPRGDQASLVREPHEIQRLVQPLLQALGTDGSPAREVEVLTDALGSLRNEVLACRTFTELVAGGALDRLRTFKRRLGATMLHPKILPVLLETTIAIKNRFRELWDDEEAALLADTNKVRELEKQLDGHPEMATSGLRELMEAFAAAQQRFDHGKQSENLRRDDAVKLRLALNRVLEQYDVIQFGGIPPTPAPTSQPQGTLRREPGEPAPSPFSTDALLQEYVSKILFALELVGDDRPAAEAVAAKELVSLRLEPCEVEACRYLLEGQPPSVTIAYERARLLVQAAALRIRMDEEAREIDRLHRRGSDHLGETLEQATHSLQRAAEIDQRFAWLVADALYRGDTGFLEQLHRCRFRLLRAHSGLWLVHNERGGISPF